ncbi:nucleotide-binding universal stress UspA family protein [Nocardia transvalensis]|uniref:Nucleotide-binding universal stress UspA family protein n=1 Tax=Nocardia transvalensis TaxID=37333 RepID=A0A7W9PID1_9NOCA|nr:universal stress protein [Nocardia transvalensis]MBB5916706.1 nucleotide-binding universal stress UspA family protein [Nocardia transvalensis]
MTDHPQTPATAPNPPVLAAIDGSAVSYHAGAWAAVDAALHGCDLHLITSVSLPVGFGPVPILGEGDFTWLHADAERMLTEATRVARAAVPGTALTIRTEVVTEPIIPVLVERSRHVRTLVVGSRGLGALRRGLLGSVSTAVTRHAHCPVAVVHSTSATDSVSVAEPVLVGVDGSDNSVPALEFAFDEASRRKVGLVALHAWTDVSAGLDVSITGWDTIRETEDAVFAEELAGYSERYPDVPVRRVLVCDRPVRSLLEESERAQLLVVGSHGRGGFAGMLLGSTSGALVQSVECPIVVVRRSTENAAGQHNS